MLKSPFKWGRESTSFAEINNCGYLFIESLLALTLSTAISIFYLSLITTMLFQVEEGKNKVELSRAAYDLSRLEYTDDWHRQTGSFNISGRYSKDKVYVFETISGNHLEILLPEIDQEDTDG